MLGLGVKVQPRIVVKGEGWGWKLEVALGFKALAWGLVWGSDCNRVRVGVRPGRREHLGLSRCGKHLATQLNLKEKPGEIRNDLLVH